MGTLQTILSIAGGIVLLAGAAGVVYAIALSSGQDARIKRLDEENVGYLRRLNYLEPLVKQLQRENEMLHDLHNPADQIRALAEQEQANHTEAMAAFDRLATAIENLAGTP